MAKRRKHRHGDEDWQEERGARKRRKRGRRFERAEEDSAVAVAEPPKPRPVTCRQCAHLVITRSLVKHVSQSWDHAVAFPTFTCFQQRWTLEDPESVPDHAAISEYLVEGADRCPDYVRGYPRDHHGW
ncbi:MAG: hypothetical protein JO247_05025 [Chloroflexi bacterium]|nr:hypothetical protein [Chloroflexota bacterium]